MKVLFNQSLNKISLNSKFQSIPSFTASFQNDEFLKSDLYTEKTWNEIYKNQKILPWTQKGWTDKSIEAIIPYMKATDSKILDYGCGSGDISKYLSERGYNVIASDISSEAVEKLKSQKLDFDVIKAAHPNQINAKIFDCIISMGVFHHINPKYWQSFLSDFSEKLTEGGKLIIAGWDKNDAEFIETPQRISKVTKNKTWFVNDLADKKLLSACNLRLEDTKLIPFLEPSFDKKRLIRCFLFRKL